MFSYVYDPTFMLVFKGAPKEMSRPLGSLAGQSVKIMNFTNFDLTVYAVADQVDIIPAYQYLVMPNEPDLIISIAGVSSTNYQYPNMYVAAKTFDDVLTYEVGSLIHFMSVSPGDTINVAGSMTISNTPNVFVSGGSMNVSFNGTQNVALVGTATVNATIQGTPSVTIANASLPITGNVGITSGTVNATIQNAQLNTQVTNALLQTGGLVASQPVTQTVTLVNGQTSTNFALPIPLSAYDLFYVLIQSSGGSPTTKYKISLADFGINGVSDTKFDVRDLTYVKSGVGFTNGTPIQNNGLESVGNVILITVTNVSGATITSDTVTITAYCRYASSQVTNKSNQPVPTTGNYYGTGADGVFSPTANTTLNNPANAPAIYNYTSVNIPAGVTVNFQNQAKYVILYSQGDVTINGDLVAAKGMQNITSNTPISINGKTLPNAGNGGNGGAGQGSVSGGTGGTGGIGNAYAPGNGGGGGGGGSNVPASAGGSGGTGYGFAPGGAGGPTGGAAGTGAETIEGATIAVVAGGNIIVGGRIVSVGIQGGNAGASGVNSGGGGGSCGNNQGGAGQNGAGFGGSAGGSGGGVVFLFAGGQVSIGGTIANYGGSGGTTGTPGAGGQAGPISIYQYGGTLGV